MVKFGGKRKKKRQERDNVADRLASIKSAPKPSLSPDDDPKPRRRSGKKEREPRAPAFKNAQIIYGRDRQTPCIIRDYSASGVRIAMEASFALPPVITLRTMQAELSGRARVVWQDGGEAGLAMIDE